MYSGPCKNCKNPGFPVIRLAGHTFLECMGCHAWHYEDGELHSQLKRITVEMPCTACNRTGINLLPERYGRPGVAYLCPKCKGRGGVPSSSPAYFDGRHPCDGVTTVEHHPSATPLPNVPYTEFLAGKMPTAPEEPQQAG